MSHSVAAVIGLLSGCGPGADAWPAVRADAECALYERCDLLIGFDHSEPTCHSLISSQEQALINQDACNYTAAAARACLDALDSLACEQLNGERADPLAACDLVCGDEQ